MSKIQYLYIGNDMALEIAGLKNRLTGDYINDASVAVTLKDASGNSVSGQTWPFTMTYVTGSNGKYRALLEDGLTLTANARYTAYVTADCGSDMLGAWELDLVAKTRRQ